MTRETKDDPVGPGHPVGPQRPGEPDARRTQNAARLLEAARGYAPDTRVSLAELEALARRGHLRGRQIPLRSAVAVGVVLLLVSSAASVALSRGWPFRLWQPPPPVPAVSTPPTPATAAPKKKRRVRLALNGPAKLEVAGDDPTIVLEEGSAEITSDARATEVHAGNTRFEVPPASTVTVQPESPGVWRTVPGTLPDPAPKAPPSPSSSRLPTAPEQPHGAAPGRASLRRKLPLERPPETGSLPSVASSLPGGLVDLPALKPTTARSRDEETALLHEAARRLRAASDGAGALALLEAHDARFSEGPLARVAAVLRVEALLAVGRTREAWVRLEALPADEIAQSPRLRLARAELRSLHGHCPEALDDLRALATLSAADVTGLDPSGRVIRVRKACEEKRAP